MRYKRRAGDRGMNLETACKIGARPAVYRPNFWTRALRILMRWASEPCAQREFQKRIALCRKVHVAIQDWITKLEKLRTKRWTHKTRFKVRGDTTPSITAGELLARKNGLNGHAPRSKAMGHTSSKKRATLGTPATRRAKPRGSISATPSR